MFVADWGRAACARVLGDASPGRAASRFRLIGDPWGRVAPDVLLAIEERTRLLLGLAQPDSSWASQ